MKVSLSLIAFCLLLSSIPYLLTQQISDFEKHIRRNIDYYRSYADAWGEIEKTAIQLPMGYSYTKLALYTQNDDNFYKYIYSSSQLEEPYSIKLFLGVVTHYYVAQRQELHLTENKSLVKTKDLSIHDRKYTLIQELVDKWLNEKKNNVLKFILSIECYENVIKNDNFYIVRLYITTDKFFKTLILDETMNEFHIINSFSF